jgi:hypothetical protein
MTYSYDFRARNASESVSLYSSDMNSKEEDDFPGSYFTIQNLPRTEGEKLEKKVKAKKGFEVSWSVDASGEGTLEVFPSDMEAPWSRWTHADHSQVLAQVKKFIKDL